MQVTQPSRKQPHEIDLQQLRSERVSEIRKLDSLKARLLAMVDQQKQQARAS